MSRRMARASREIDIVNRFQSAGPSAARAHRRGQQEAAPAGETGRRHLGGRSAPAGPCAVDRRDPARAARHRHDGVSPAGVRSGWGVALHDAPDAVGLAAGGRRGQPAAQPPNAPHGHRCADAGLILRRLLHRDRRRRPPGRAGAGRGHDGVRRSRPVRARPDDPLAQALPADRGRGLRHADERADARRDRLQPHHRRGGDLRRDERQHAAPRRAGSGLPAGDSRPLRLGRRGHPALRRADRAGCRLRHRRGHGFRAVRRDALVDGPGAHARAGGIVGLRVEPRGAVRGRCDRLRRCAPSATSACCRRSTTPTGSDPTWR